MEARGNFGEDRGRVLPPLVEATRLLVEGHFQEMQDLSVIQWFGGAIPCPIVASAIILNGINGIICV